MQVPPTASSSRAAIQTPTLSHPQAAFVLPSGSYPSPGLLLLCSLSGSRWQSLYLALGSSPRSFILLECTGLDKCCQPIEG